MNSWLGSMLRVQRVLSRYVNPVDFRSSSAIGKGLVKPKRVWFCSEYSKGVLILFQDGTWTSVGMSGGSPRNLTGCIGEYNVNALTLVKELPNLRLITRKEADAFREWFHGEDSKMRDRSALKQARETAEAQGWELKRKDLRKKTPTREKVTG